MESKGFRKIPGVQDWCSGLQGQLERGFEDDIVYKPIVYIVGATTEEESELEVVEPTSALLIVSILVLANTFIRVMLQTVFQAPLFDLDATPTVKGES